MRLSTVAALMGSASLVSGYLDEPPTTAAASTVSDCSNWHIVTTGETCASVVSSEGIALADFRAYNPVTGTTACNLITGNSYCIERNWGVPAPFPGVTTTSAPAPTSTTSAGNGVSTPTPIQTGMATNCNKFYKVVSGDLAGNGVSTPTPIQTGMVTNCNRFYKVVSGDQCNTIATANNVALANILAWNPAVGSACTSLWLDTYICIGVIGGTTLPPAATSTTSAGNGIATPTPVQPNVATNCNKFHKVVSGNQCGTLAAQYGISLANLYAWNPTVGTACAGLWADYYICVGVIGSIPNTSIRTTTTSAGNGIATPTPILTGMIASCKKFHLVVSGNQCGTLATQYGITMANFYAWNTGVGSSCGSLWAGYYVCVGI
ncbi:hypothetical protein B0T22DRAFT_502239 [Podospora appendiculata]|uniref:LysM domain-containing protein n=1 Tax=Podospora appendiculata TaxID=314037 RepID=A0AAE0WZY9_9PEZI|nr:hypothetical protein B0T22DRAFT_502239 [Podospora appendiculata]